MTNDKILITGIGGPSGKATASFLKANKISFIGVDMNPEIGKEYPNQFFVVPPAIDNEFIPRLLEIAKREGVKLIIPTVDEEFIPIITNIKLFKDAGINLIVSSLDTVRICRDKHMTADFLNKRGIQVPRTMLCGNVTNEEIEQIGCPLIVKPRSGRGGKGITVFKTEPELRECISNFDSSFMIQEFIDGQEYDVNMFIHDGKVLVNQVLLKTELEHGNYGNATKTVPIRDAVVEEVASKVAKVLHAEGPIDIDIRKTADGSPYVLEINPRIGANLLKAPNVLIELLKLANIRG
jgi:carbamoylphosphate synthase large subunit